MNNTPENGGESQMAFDMRAAMLERIHKRQFDARLPVPHDLFALARTDQLISTYISAWRNGQCSWEGALIAIVCAQKQVNDKLMEHARVIMDHSAMPFLVPGVGDWQGGEGEEQARNVVAVRGMNLLAQHGRTLVVAAHPNFLCERWYKWIVVAVNHEKLGELIQEGKQPLKG